MNAKKIMGAVLVALLAAALFVGAGAAAEYGPVFVYQKTDLPAGLPTGDWNYGAATVNVGADGVIPQGTFVEGTYKKGSDTLIVKYPTVTIDGVAGSVVDGSAYKFIGGVYYQETKPVTLTATAALPFDLYLTKPNGEEIKMDNATIAKNLEDGNFSVGDYSIRAKFNALNFSNGTLVTNLISKPVTFKIAEAGDATITASVTEVLKGEAFKVVVTGQPGIEYNITFDANDFKVPANQIYLGNTAEFNKTFAVIIPNTGSVEFVMIAQASAGDSEKIDVKKGTDKQASITIKFMKGTLTAKTEFTSYFVGDTIKVTGASTAGEVNTTVALAGTNFENLSIPVTIKGDKDDWSFELDTASVLNNKFAGKKLDVGTYTLTIGTNTGVKATVPITLKQPFISIVEAPEVVVQGDEVEFIVNAEATTQGVQYYVFGTNYFFASNTTENVEDTENQFVFKLNETQTGGMDAGQYFMVIQHPMYDQKFNIAAILNKIFLLEYGVTNNGTASNYDVIATELFNVDLRQTANAAQALCDALDNQNIDDMYVKYSFFVVGKNQGYSISEIPTQVVKGDKIVISGVDTANEGKTVQVEMISTAFAAVPKETVGSAAFIVVTTEVADDGTWEITLDTSDLNVDEYSLSVAINDEVKKNAKVNVVEGEPTVEPTTEPTTVPTEQPTEQPTEPTSPGFGALAALAGLGAVAVLLLRRE